jgi:hypothetical protein
MAVLVVGRIGGLLIPVVADGLLLLELVLTLLALLRGIDLLPEDVI